MSGHADVLKALMPIALGAEHEADDMLTGAYLDASEISADALLAEVFPDSAADTLDRWERILGVQAGADSGVEDRRAAIIAMLRATGGLSRAYFIAIGQALGYNDIAIYEPQPFTAGVSGANDRLYVSEILFQWAVLITEIPPAGYFYSGAAHAGERLCSFQVLDIQDLFNDLKPAQSFCYFVTDMEDA